MSFVIQRLANRYLPVVLAGLLVITQAQAAEQAAVPAQAAPAQAAPAQATPGQPVPATPGPPAAPAQPLAQLPVEQSLSIRVLAGSNEMNDLERRVMAPLVVQVSDHEERPVDTAEVVFRFPVSGPGATFSDGKTSKSVRTNGEGQAAALNWMANGQVGKFQVHVTATYGNQVGETTLTMINVTRVVDEKPKSTAAGWWSHRWVKVAVIGGIAVIGVGVFLATRGGSKGSSGTTIGVSPGSPTVGAP
jgi:hypothetical protein